MKKEMNNKGFSLVELIIVIAIMAVLIGVLAPQYLKYVNNSKVSTDVTNAQEIATNFNVAMADGASDLGTGASGVGGTNSNIPTSVSATMEYWPLSKLDKTATWTVTIGSNGVSKITLGATPATTYEIYPNPESSNGYYTKNHK